MVVVFRAADEIFFGGFLVIFSTMFGLYLQWYMHPPWLRAWLKAFIYTCAMCIVHGIMALGGLTRKTYPYYASFLKAMETRFLVSFFIL